MKFLDFVGEKFERKNENLRQKWVFREFFIFGEKSEKQAKIGVFALFWFFPKKAHFQPKNDQNFKAFFENFNLEKIKILSKEGVLGQ